MDKVKGKFPREVQPFPLGEGQGVVHGYTDFARKTHGRVAGKGDHIGGSRVVHKIGVEAPDLFIVEKNDRQFACWRRELLAGIESMEEASNLTRYVPKPTAVALVLKMNLSWPFHSRFQLSLPCPPRLDNRSGCAAC